MVRTTASERNEKLHVVDDPATDLRGVIAIHSTVPGLAFGGCRLWDDASSSDLAHDAMRLFASCALGGGNAGGIINVAAEYQGEREAEMRGRVAQIPARLREVLRVAGETGQAPHEVADAMVDRIMARHPAKAA